MLSDANQVIGILGLLAVRVQFLNSQVKSNFGSTINRFRSVLRSLFLGYVRYKYQLVLAGFGPGDFLTALGGVDEDTPSPIHSVYLHLAEIDMALNPVHYRPENVGFGTKLCDSKPGFI